MIVLWLQPSQILESFVLASKNLYNINMLNFIHNFTGEQVIGLNISDFSAEATILEKKRNGWRVLSFARFRLSPGLIEDGYILQPEKLTEDLKKLFALGKPQAMKASSIFLSIPDSKVFTRTLSLPKNLKRKDFLTVAYSQAEELVPEELNNLIPAIKILPINNGQAQVFYAAAKKDLIDQWSNFFESMGLDIIGITMESVSSLAGLADDLKKEETLMLDLGARTTIASIFNSEGIQDSIVIPIAGDHITDAIVKKLNISHTAAEDQKRKVGMDPSVEQGEIMWIIQGQLQPVADELKKFITFYEETTGRKIKNLLLVGGTAQIKGIEKYFSENLSLKFIPVETIVGQHKFKFHEYLQAAKYINALGLAKLGVEGKVDINFYQTLRVDLQQRVDLQNLSLWAKSIKVFLKKLPSLIATRLGIFFVFIFLLAGFVLFKYDYLMQKIAPSHKSFDQEITVALANQSWNNFVPAIEKTENIVLKKSYFFVPYNIVLENLNTEAETLALSSVADKIPPSQFLINQVISNNIVSIWPSEENFVVGGEVNMRASYYFWSIDKEDARKVILSGLSPKDASKYINWPVNEQTFELASELIDGKYFIVKTHLDLRKP